MRTYLFIDGGHLRTNYNNSVRRWFGIDGEINFSDLKESLRGGGVPLNAASITTLSKTNGDTANLKTTLNYASKTKSIF